MTQTILVGGPNIAQSEVLIIDDDPGIVDALTTLLEDEGYKVGHASNGHIGLEYLKNHGDTKLILLDLMMPFMDGYEFRKCQQRETAIASIPVVVLTAGTVDVERLKVMKFAAYLKKNMDIGIMLETIRKYVSRDLAMSG
jgi:two-component system, chemotaxis family, chemotaxis protein CheY